MTERLPVMAVYSNGFFLFVSFVWCSLKVKSLLALYNDYIVVILFNWALLVPDICPGSVDEILAIW